MITEDLKILYDRAQQYSIAKYNNDPYHIALEPDGTISVHLLVAHGCCGDPDEFTDEYFKVEDLSSDLDAVIAERKKKEEEERKKQQEKWEKEKKEREERDRNNRKAEYLKLKKEFE